MLDRTYTKTIQTILWMEKHYAFLAIRQTAGLW
jgi:hypothetical protein